MSVIRATTPYVRTVLWDIPYNTTVGALTSLRAIPAAIAEKAIPDVCKAAVPVVTDHNQYGTWLGAKICNGLSSFWHEGVSRCVDARKYFLTAGKFSMDVLSTIGTKLQGKGAIIVAGIALVSAILGYQGIKGLKGEHNILRLITNNYTGDGDNRKWVHTGMFLSHGAMVAGALTAICTFSPVGVVIALAGLGGNLAFNFMRWLKIGGHWFNAPNNAPLGLSNWIRNNDYRWR